MSRHLDHLKAHVIAGFNITCVGDERAHSYLPSKAENTISDQVAKHVLKWFDPFYAEYSWRDRGSDERQYCVPGNNFPIASIMRTKYGKYPEYHTSLDDFNVMAPKGLEGGYMALQKALTALERSSFPQVRVYGEPQLGKRGLYPTVGSKVSNKHGRLMLDVMSYCDEKMSLLDIAERCDVPIWELYTMIDVLHEQELIF